MAKKRKKLTAARYDEGWSQEEAAEKIGVTRGTLSLWERGLTDPYPHHIHRLCEIFGKDAAALDLQQREQEIIQTNISESRRMFLQTLGFVGTELITSPFTPSFIDDVYQSQSISPASLHNLSVITQKFRQIQLQGDISIKQGIYGHIQTLQDMLGKTLNDKVRRELWRILALTQLVARLNPAKKHEFAQIKNHNELAIAYAQMSGDTALIGATVGHLAQFYLRQEVDLDKATQLVHQAQKITTDKSALNGWFSLLLASISAKMRQQEQCNTYLMEAMSNAHQGVQSPEYYDAYCTDFSVISANVFSINCWLTIGNVKKAQTDLAKTDFTELANNRCASAFYDASRLYTMLGDLDLAQNYAFRAIDKASATSQFYVIPRCIQLASNIQEKDRHEPHAKAVIEYAYNVLQDKQE